MLLLVVFLLGTTGVSILRHICNTSHSDNVSLYPGIFVNRLTDCCGETQDACACMHTPEEPSQPLQPEIFTGDCCKTIATFLRLEIQTLRGEKLEFTTALKDLPGILPFMTDVIPADPVRDQSCPVQWHAPPVIFGKELVHFLHQIKIPAYPSVG
jgi:hypothetical protein